MAVNSKIDYVTADSETDMPTPADKAREQMASMGLSAPNISSKETRTEEEIKADRKTLAENVPILGEAILAKEIADDVKDENYLSAGLNTAALAVGVIPGVGKVASKPIRALAKSTRKGYNPEDPASRVFHLTKTDFDAADVVGKGTNDIGFHVGTAAQANARGSTGVKYDKELAEKMVEKERVLPMVLKQTLKPARIIDVGSFKEPKNWISNLSVAKKDKQLINFLLGDSADADLLAKAPRVTVGGDTYYMLPDVMRSGVDENLWKDIILEAHKAKRLGLDTINKQSDRVEWFNTLKQTANKNGYDSFVYKNEYEGAKELSKSASKGDSYMLLEPDQAKGLFGDMTEGNPAYMKNKGGLMLQSGGVVPMNNMAKQMEMFDEGGLMDEGGTVDPVSGNDVPPGSNQEEVRDDIPAQLSEGEFVFPADVVRFIGLEKLMMIRQRAKAGLQRMDDMGQMGNSEEAIMPDNLPFSIEDLDMEDDGLEMAQGGVVNMANGGSTPQGTYNVPDPNAGVYYNPTSQTTTGVAAPPVQAASVNPAKTIQANTPTVGTNSTKETFENYVGQNIPGVDFRYVTYVDENGNNIQLRQSISTDEMIDPVPEGYTFVDPTETKVDTTASQTSTVKSVVDDGGGDNEAPGPSTTDVTGIGYNKSNLAPEIADLVSKYGAGFGTLSDLFVKGPMNASLDMPGIMSTLGAKATAPINALTSSAFGGVIDSFRGMVGNQFSKETPAGAIIAGIDNYQNQKSLDNLTFDEVNRLTVNTPKVMDSLQSLFQDKNGKAISQDKAMVNVRAEAAKYGVETKAGWGNRNLTAVVREIAAAKEKEFERDRQKDKETQRQNTLAATKLSDQISSAANARKNIDRTDYATSGSDDDGFAGYSGSSGQGDAPGADAIDPGGSGGG